MLVPDVIKRCHSCELAEYINDEMLLVKPDLVRSQLIAKIHYWHHRCITFWLRRNTKDCECDHMVRMK